MNICCPSTLRPSSLRHLKHACNESHHTRFAFNQLLNSMDSSLYMYRIHITVLTSIHITRLSCPWILFHRKMLKISKIGVHLVQGNIRHLRSLVVSPKIIKIPRHLYFYFDALEWRFCRNFLFSKHSLITFVHNNSIDYWFVNTGYHNKSV